LTHLSSPSRDRPSFPTRRSSDLAPGAPDFGWSGVDVHRRVEAEGRGVGAAGRDEHELHGVGGWQAGGVEALGLELAEQIDDARVDRKSTRLNSSHQIISYAVFCF